MHRLRTYSHPLWYCCRCWVVVVGGGGVVLTHPPYRTPPIYLPVRVSTVVFSCRHHVRMMLLQAKRRLHNWDRVVGTCDPVVSEDILDLVNGRRATVRVLATFEAVLMKAYSVWLGAYQAKRSQSVIHDIVCVSE